MWRVSSFINASKTNVPIHGLKTCFTQHVKGRDRGVERRTFAPKKGYQDLCDNVVVFS